MGLRTIKTTISIFLSLAIASLLGLDLFLAGVASLGVMEKTLARSIQNTKNQIIANLLGGLYAILIGLIFPSGILIIALALFSYIAIVNTFKAFSFAWISIGCVVILAVLTIDEANTAAYIATALNRIFSIFIGVVVSAFINLAIKAPDVKNFIIWEINSFMKLALKINEKKLKPDEVFNQEILELENSLAKINNLRNDYLKEAKIKFSKIESDAPHEDLIRNTITSFIHLHNLLITFNRCSKVINHNSTMKMRTDFDFAALIMYHNELAKSIFEQYDKKLFANYVNIAQVKENHLKRDSLSVNNYDEFKVGAFFLEYCDQLIILENGLKNLSR